MVQFNTFKIASHLDFRQTIAVLRLHAECSYVYNRLNEELYMIAYDMCPSYTPMHKYEYMHFLSTLAVILCSQMKATVNLIS